MIPSNNKVNLAIELIYNKVNLAIELSYLKVNKAVGHPAAEVPVDQSV